MKYISLRVIIYVNLYQLFANAQDPCLPSGHTIKYDEFKRSVNYTTVGDPEITDRYLDPGWYKFDSPHGNDMPTHPVPLYRCGTFFPVWLDGDLPKKKDEEVEIKACAPDYDVECADEWNIKVRHCSQGADEYNVYYLMETMSVQQVYCIGTEVICPSGESSPNEGFTPGCTTGDFPLLNGTVKISATYDADCTGAGGDCQRGDRLYVVMECNIEHYETNLEFNVEWFYQDYRVKSEVLLYKDLPTKMTEKDFYDAMDLLLPGEVKCQLKPHYEGSELPGPTVEAIYWMGMEVEPIFVDVLEGESAQVFLRPTVPLLYRFGDPTNITIDIRVPIKDGDVSSCPDSRSQVRMGVDTEPQSCGPKMPPVYDVEGTEPYPILIYGPTEGEYDGVSTRVLIMRTQDSFAPHKLWQNYRLPNVEITIRDKETDVTGHICKATWDPHMLSFDQKAFDVMLEGEFILYRHRELPIEVQVYFIQGHTDAYTEVCGVAIRSGGDLFVVDYCRKDSDGAVRIEMYECKEDRMIIESTGTTYTVTVATGTVVTAVMDDKPSITIRPSIHDYADVPDFVTEGICGPFNMDISDDWTGRDGVIYDNPHDFANTWRVPDGESLYRGKIPSGARPEFKDRYYCTCQTPPECGPEDDCEPIITCGMHDACVRVDGEDVPDEDWRERCIGEPPGGSYGYLSNGQPSFYGDNVEEEVDMFPYNASYVAPPPAWRGNWTEPNARSYCEGLLDANENLKACEGIPNLDYEGAVELCVGDIHILGDSEGVDQHVAELINACQEEVTRNTSLYSYDNSTGTVLPPSDILDKLCPNNCTKRGNCVEGKCNCTADYFGSDCAWDRNKVPVIQNIQFEGLCDFRSRPCAASPVHGDYFLNAKESRCHTQTTLLLKNQTTVELPYEETLISYMHPYKILCPFPVIKLEPYVFTYGYKVSVTNNGKDYSNEVNLAVYDSLCTTCDKDLVCKKEREACLDSGRCYLEGEAKSNDTLCFLCSAADDEFRLSPDTCFIESICFSSLDAHPTDPCLHCDPGTSPTEWSPSGAPGCAAPEDPPDGLAAGAIAGIVVGSVLVVGSASVGVVFVSKKKKKEQVTQTPDLDMSEVVNMTSSAPSLSQENPAMTQYDEL